MRSLQFIKNWWSYGVILSYTTLTTTYIGTIIVHRGFGLNVEFTGNLQIERDTLDMVAWRFSSNHPIDTRLEPCGEKSVVRSSGRWIATCTHESYSLPSVLAHVLLSCSLCILLIWSNMMTVKVPYTVDIEPQCGVSKTFAFTKNNWLVVYLPLWKILQ